MASTFYWKSLFLDRPSTPYWIPEPQRPYLTKRRSKTTFTKTWLYSSRTWYRPDWEQTPCRALSSMFPTYRLAAFTYEITKSPYSTSQQLTSLTDNWISIRLSVLSAVTS